MPDLLIHNEGTVIGIQPVSELGRGWVGDNLISEDWQWLGNTLWVDHRLASAIVAGATNDGLEVA